MRRTFFSIQIIWTTSILFENKMDISIQIIMTAGIFFDDEMNVKDFIHLNYLNWSLVASNLCQILWLNPQVLNRSVQ